MRLGICWFYRTGAVGHKQGGSDPDEARDKKPVHAAEIDGEKVGPRRNLSMPGLSATVGEQIDALRRVAGDKVVARIKRVPDPAIIKIVSGWAERCDPQRAIALGFVAEKNFDEIIRAHIEDELNGQIA